MNRNWRMLDMLGKDPVVLMPHQFWKGNSTRRKQEAEAEGHECYIVDREEV